MLNRRKQPARLEKEEELSVMDFLNQGKTFTIKMWVIITILMILFLILCFMSKGPTYGYL